MGLQERTHLWQHRTNDFGSGHLAFRISTSAGDGAVAHYPDFTSKKKTAAPLALGEERRKRICSSRHCDFFQQRLIMTMEANNGCNKCFIAH
jgi:hypothetical protein